MKGTNEAVGIISEYSQRSTLRKLGFVTSTGDLSVFKAECFNIIQDEISRQQSLEMKKARKR